MSAFDAVEALRTRANPIGISLDRLIEAAELSSVPDASVGLVANMRLALASFSATSQSESLSLERWRLVFSVPFDDRGFEERIARWRGRPQPIEGHEVLAAIVAHTPDADQEVRSIAATLCLLVVLRLAERPVTEALRQIADASRKGRQIYLWQLVLKKLPRPEGSFEHWLDAVVGLDAKAASKQLANSSHQAALSFFNALASQAAALKDQRRPRATSSHLRESERPAATDQPLALFVGDQLPPTTPSAEHLSQAPHSPDSVIQSPRRRSRPGARLHRRSRADHTRLGPARASRSRRNRENEASDSVDLPDHDILEFEPSPSRPEEPPEPIQYTLDLQIDEPITPPTLNTQQSAERRHGYRLLELGARLPWHWDHLNPHDLGALLDALADAASKPEPNAGALLTGVMLCTGLPIHHVIRAPAPVQPIFSKLIYAPEKRWSGSEAESLLEPTSPAIGLQWPPIVLQLAKAFAGSGPQSGSLENLVQIHDEPSASHAVLSWLGEVRTKNLGLRLTHGRIARHLALTIRSISGAEWIVYALCGTEDDVAPIAAYYSASPSGQIEQIHNRAIAKIFRLPTPNPTSAADPGKDRLKYIGARIASTRVIQYWIRNLIDSVIGSQAVSMDLVERHNSFAVYTTWLLMAATGHRPVKDPFESRDIFDLDRGLCLISDKASRASDEARLVPLGPLAIAAVEAWIDHVNRLRNAQLTSRLRACLESVTAKQAVRAMPLIFLLRREDGEVGWEPISESTLEANLGTLTGLTANFFRRQLATLFASTNVADELARSVLGHEETRVAPLGPLSTRCAQDLDAVGNVVGTWLLDLGWKRLDSPLREIGAAMTVARSPVLAPYQLGSIQRREDRRSKEREVTRQARQHLAGWLRNARRAGITQQSVDALFNSLGRLAMLDEMEPIAADLIGRAHDHALRFVERCGIDAIRLPARRKRTKPEQPAFLTGDFARAQLADSIRSEFRSLLEKRARARVAPSPERAFAEACISLAVHSLVCDTKMTKKLLSEGRFALSFTSTLGVQLRIEHRNKNRPGVVLTTRRYPLHPATAALFSRCESIQQPDEKEDKARERRRIKEYLLIVKTLWERSGDHLSPQPNSLDGASRWLQERFVAEIRLRHPGHIAAYLDGTTGSVGLPQREWLELLGHHVSEGDQHANVDEAACSSDQHAIVEPLDRAPELLTAGEEEEAKRRTQRLHRAVIKALESKDPDDDDPEPDASPGRRYANEKRDAVAALNDVLKACPDAPELSRALVQWTIQLIEGNPGDGDSKQGRLRFSSCKRYYYALALLVRDHAFDVRLEDATGEVLADTYAEMLEAVEPTSLDMTLGRLREFHAFLVHQHGVGEIDWADVAPEGASDNFAPDAGFITHAQYRQALALLSNDSSVSMRERRAQAFVLILQYRFGLRIGEITGLRKADLIKPSVNVDRWIVLVRPNEHRQIKSFRGTRQVPLLETLSHDESAALSDWFDHAEEQAGADRIAVLLNRSGSTRRILDRGRLSARITSALRAVTGKDSVRLHHLRHSYATRILTLLSVKEGGEIHRHELVSRLCGGASPDAVQTALLGRPGPDGRALWALATLIGHSSPRMTLRWYIHSVEILAMLTARDCARNSPITLHDFETRYWLGGQVAGLKSVDRIDEEMLVSARPTAVEILDVRAPVIRDACLPAITTSKDGPLSVMEIDQILDVAFRRGPSQDISSRVMRRVEDVQTVLQTDHRVRSRATFDLPRGRWLPTSSVAAVTYSRAGSRVAPETKRLRVLWPAIHDRKDDAAFAARCRRMADLWLDRYRASSTPLILHSQDELNDAIEWLSDVGVELKQIWVTVDGQELDAEFVETVPYADRMRSKEWLLNIRTPHRRLVNERFGLQVRRNRSGPIPNTAAMHRVMHVLAIWLELSSTTIVPRNHLNHRVEQA